MEPIYEKIIGACGTLYHKGLACSTGGNISVRTGDTIYITKTNTALGHLSPKDIICCAMDGTPLETGKPSKEITFHAAIYAGRPDIGAVVHLHSPYAMMLGMFPALSRTDFLPRCSPGAVSRVGKVPVIEYYTPGSKVLAKRVGDLAIQAARAIFLEKHGIITYSHSLEEAADIAEEFEHNARLYVMTNGKIPLLSDEEAELLRK